MPQCNNSEIKTKPVTTESKPIAELLKTPNCTIGTTKIKMNGKEYEMEVELSDGSAPSVKTVPSKAAPAVTSAPAAASSNVTSSEGTVVSPMPGTILKVNVKAGDKVNAGDSVVILEAMKMENDITAPKSGTVKSVSVEAGKSVSKGDVLFEVE